MKPVLESKSHLSSQLCNCHFGCENKNNFNSVSAWCKPSQCSCGSLFPEIQLWREDCRHDSQLSPCCVLAQTHSSSRHTLLKHPVYPLSHISWLSQISVTSRCFGSDLPAESSLSFHWYSTIRGFISASDHLSPACPLPQDACTSFICI